MSRFYEWIGIVIAILIGLVLWVHFFPPSNSKISNNIMLNEPLGVRTRILPHQGLPIKKASNSIISKLTNLTRAENDDITSSRRMML
jgi:hypothetical protein